MSICFLLEYWSAHHLLSFLHHPHWSFLPSHLHSDSVWGCVQALLQVTQKTDLQTIFQTYHKVTLSYRRLCQKLFQDSPKASLQSLDWVPLCQCRLFQESLRLQNFDWVLLSQFRLFHESLQDFPLASLQTLDRATLLQSQLYQASLQDSRQASLQTLTQVT